VKPNSTIDAAICRHLLVRVRPGVPERKGPARSAGQISMRRAIAGVMEIGSVIESWTCRNFRSQMVAGRLRRLRPETSPTKPPTA